MKLLASIADVLLPRFCKVCGRRLALSEQHLCVACQLDLPVMDYHPGIPCHTERLLMGELSVVRAASFIRYDKDSEYRKILYHLKYYNHPDVGHYLGRQAALYLQERGFFDGIDLLVPVPLSRKKLRKRGYNQCDYLARGIASITGISIETRAIVRCKANTAQAKKGRFERWSNAEGIFAVSRPELLEGHHALLIDDVITTGATTATIAEMIEKSVPNAKISIFTLALAT